MEFLTRPQKHQKNQNLQKDLLKISTIRLINTQNHLV